ncbi:hypothetical protein [Thermodesulfovibrio yellowstonii]|uniref:Uncharacterized protein n=1 Tax=Thermodesulfovibrio yellowstonii TaxID=28262 RepID=A0A9W6GH76_9BACT|nr:hypothetical protein [Thermodesulfovibrio islandicus]GLI53849.1 hypothetical protein TISLANDTSLP1_15420 [Thermodesulfovibrio islandicus]
MLKRRKTLVRLLFFGAITGILYAGLFFNEPIINALCARGGLYALFPVATAFVFSFAHGNFTNYFWQALGIEAKKGAEKTLRDRPVDRREIRTQLRA